MKVTMSKYLLGQKETLKHLINELSKKYQYASVLGVDTTGKQFRVQGGSINISDSNWVERGFVVRVHNGLNYSEFSFNEILEEEISIIIDKIDRQLVQSLPKINGIDISRYAVLDEEAMKMDFLGEVEILPEMATAQEKINRLITIKDAAMKHSEYLVNFMAGYEEVHISKIFISSKKELEQSYIWGVGSLLPIMRKGNNTKYSYEAFSGLKAVEILGEMERAYGNVIDETVKLLDSKRVEPGEYDVICSPEITGLIAHEAFGHGVEMDMFVKNRAKAVEYLGKTVASQHVIMHDGAAAAKEVSSYLFDDEGTIGTDTIVIDKGTLITGISDSLSALRLGTKPTGNGKRESFERKAYARMTNTFFEAGKDRLEDMIASIKKGYLITNMMSGMEDPKNWGIQCVAIRGEEIIDGKLTGNIISPVLMTGYVPDVLKAISMVSDKVELFGAGVCGKGHKEYAKASDGGPYIKTRVRLG